MEFPPTLFSFEMQANNETQNIASLPSATASTPVETQYIASQKVEAQTNNETQNIASLPSATASTPVETQYIASQNKEEQKVETQYIASPKRKNMSNSDYFQNKYRSKTVRADWIDYNNGDFFVTICTKDKLHYFGNIENDNINLSVVGEFVLHAIKNISIHSPYCEVLDFVIMPNHVHLILSVSEQNLEAQTNNETQNIASLPSATASTLVETQYIASQKVEAQTNNETQNIASLPSATASTSVETQYIASQSIASLDNKKLQEIAKQRSLLARAISNFKGAVTRFANVNNIPFAWQSRFYDNFIRNQAMMNKIADYVENNIIRWETDCYF